MKNLLKLVLLAFIYAVVLIVQNHLLLDGEYALRLKKYF